MSNNEYCISDAEGKKHRQGTLEIGFYYDHYDDSGL